MFKRHVLLSLLSLGLMACGSSGPVGGTTPDAFFSTQPDFGAAIPVGAQELTPEQFKNLVGSGAKVVTAQSLANEKTLQDQQDAQDTQDAAAYIAAHSEFAALLQPDAAGALNLDGDRLTQVDTAGGPKNVVLMGHAFGRASLATHARTYPTQTNQANLYVQLYPDLDWTLKQIGNSVQQFGLPTPDEARKLDAAHLLALNKQVGGIVSEYASRIPNLAYLLDPASMEEGSKDQLDRTQIGACKPAAALGLYKNFSWPLKTLTTSVKDQGQRGTCWAFATVAALEAEIARRDHREVNLSEQDYVGHRFLDWAPRAFGDGGDPIFIAQKASAANYTFAFESGWQYDKSLNRVVPKGTQTYTHSCDGYQDATHNLGVCSDTNDQGYFFYVPLGGKLFVIRSLPNSGSSGYRMQSPTDFWDQSDKDRSMVILLLRSVLGHSTTLTLDMRYVFPDANGYAPNRTMNKRPDGAPDFELDHVMTVTGFISSQNLHRKVPAAPIADDFGYFIVKNSWGDCWGDQGYVYLPWSWVKTFVGQASTNIAPQ